MTMVCCSPSDRRIRTYLVPIEQIVKEPGVPERLASAVRGFSDEVWKSVSS
jgi:hypothetical protein